MTIAADSAVADEDDFAEYDNKIIPVNDPLESFNRVIFTFNDRLHIWVLEPTAKVYSKAVPSLFRTGIRNFFSNLMEPARFLNCLLQGRFSEAHDVFLRFLLNSTAGVLGIMDPATYDGMKTHDRRFASTLSNYGAGRGPYLVLPFFGPSDIRGFFGLVGDTLTNPVFWTLRDEPLAAVAVQGGKAVNRTSFHLGEYQRLLSGTLDPYIAIRNVYRQSEQ
ncbi:MAG: VacJ family lipoprotein [Deltaproteobacteria bacterium]|nr:VacJ family lipoprotein [Deltaproteobacteria bacterium]